MTVIPEPKDKPDTMATQRVATALGGSAVVNGPEDELLVWAQWIGVPPRTTYGACGRGSSRRRRPGTSRGSAICRR